jgi:hypothetical protein
METTKNSQKWQLRQENQGKETVRMEMMELPHQIATKGLYSYILCSIPISFGELLGLLVRTHYFAVRGLAGGSRAVAVAPSVFLIRRAPVRDGDHCGAK